MRGWEVPPAIRAAMREPIGPDTPVAVLEALRDAVAVRAEIFPDAELARQALELLLQRMVPPKEAERLAAADTEAGVVVDDSDDCLGCQ